MVPSLLVCLTAMLSLRCTMQIVSQHEETISTQPVSRTYDLKITKAPTIDDPKATFTAFRQDSVGETTQRTIAFIRKPSVALRTGLWLTTLALGVLTGAVLESSHKWPMVLGVPAIAAGVSSYYVEEMAGKGKGWNGQRIQRTSEKRNQLTPCVVTVKADSKECGSIQMDETGGSFDLSGCLDSLPRDQDVALTITIRDTPQVCKTIFVAEDVIAGLRRLAEQQDSARREAAKEFAREFARFRQETRRLDSIRGEESERKAIHEASLRNAAQALRYSDAFISLGMTQQEVEDLVGGELTWGRQYHSYGVGVTKVVGVNYELAKDTWLILSYTYSHFAGAYLLDGVTYGTTGIWSWGFAIGTTAPDEYGSIPANYTGQLKREGRRWYCEYYWKGEPKWRE